MAIDKRELIEIIEKTAPPELMEDWDNSGIQIMCSDDPVERILVCLDVCEDTIEEAVEMSCDFILSHHPVFFGSIRQLRIDDNHSGMVIRLIKEGISVYSAHTTFDAAVGGNNDRLAEILNLKNVEIPEEEPVMRIGKPAEPLSLGKLCGLINEKIMKNKGLSYGGDPERIVHTVGICTGAGASLLETAVKSGCDVLITGDVKYHDYQNAENLGIAVIDAGHFETEILFAANMGEKLAKAISGNNKKAEVIISKSQRNFLKRYNNMA